MTDVRCQMSDVRCWLLRCTHVVGLLCILHFAFYIISCSTTSNLPEGEVLYTGIDKVKVHDKQGTAAEETALVEVQAALDYAPNGAFMGSSFTRSPLQVGLWVYNAYVNQPRVGFNKWIFNSFAAQPVTMTHVSPDIRVKVATNLLQNYGYFRGRVGYEIVPQRNPKKQKISYDVTLGQPYLFDSIRYAFPALEDSLIRASIDEPYIHRGSQFSTLDLTNEKTRIVTALRNNGFYYYRPDYVAYFADSVNTPYRVNLLVAPDLDMPEKAKRQYYFGTVSTYIRQNMRSSEGMKRRAEGTMNTYDDSIVRRSTKVAYQGKRMPIAPRVLFKNFKFRHRKLFSQADVDKTLSNLHSMDIFSSVKLTFSQREAEKTVNENTSAGSETNQNENENSQLSTFNSQLPTSSDTIDVRLDLTLDQLMDTEIDFNITQKSNSQVGPNLGVTFSKRNAFHHGETLSVGLKGSYEWQTRDQFDTPKRIDSYEVGTDISLSYPWIAFPWLNKRFYKYPTSTRFRVNVNELNRANYYKLMSFMAEATYGFQTSRSWSHELSPLTISYNKMEETTARFDSIILKNMALFASLEDRFIPAIQYSIIYDNVWNTRIPHSMHFEGTVKESGNFLNLTNSFLGFDYYQKDKKLLYTPYSQFLKFLFTLKNTFHLSEKTSIATRVQLGAIWTYGNSNYAPFSELFYIGGANSVRAFAVRSFGPGGYPHKGGLAAYLIHSGDVKLEMNAEYRFPFVKALQGAFFVDAGNVWLMHGEDYAPGGKIDDNPFFKTLALGTGFGLRYDLEFLILRFDLGVGIHAPYDTGKSSYYNMRKFKDSLGFHFAVGYPF